MGGALRLLRTLPDNVRKAEYRRNSLNPGPLGRPRWEFPPAWLVGPTQGIGILLRYPKWRGSRNIRGNRRFRAQTSDARGRGIPNTNNR